ncbi:MAG: ROK family protein [Firmicutes bacterium]|nr:ROK family protein [Bacillota bacterium]
MALLVIDIGGTAIKYTVMDETTGFSEESGLHAGSVPTPRTSREDLVEAIGKIYDEVCPVEGIAISLAGIIDVEKGLIEMGGALRYNNGFYIRDALYERCPVPIILENDAKCAGIAEAAEGSLKDVPNGMVLIFGTMIGGALIHDHKLYRGSHYSAGEISYTITDRGGEPTFEGVWGNQCGVPRLCRLYAGKKGLPENEVNGRVVFAGVNSGEKEALEALRIYAREIAIQIFNFQNLYDPDRFAIGGGISAQPALVETIREELAKLYEICPYFVRRAEVVTCRFRNDANLYGAYINFREQSN